MVLILLSSFLLHLQVKKKKKTLSTYYLNSAYIWIPTPSNYTVLLSPTHSCFSHTEICPSRKCAEHCNHALPSALGLPFPNYCQISISQAQPTTLRSYCLLYFELQQELGFPTTTSCELQWSLRASWLTLLYLNSSPTEAQGLPERPLVSIHAPGCGAPLRTWLRAMN